MWARHINTLVKDFENLFLRNHEMEQGVSSSGAVEYKDVVDGIVVDANVLLENTAALGHDLRTISDYLFEKVEVSLGKTAIATALKLRGDSEARYHTLYGELVAVMREFKSVQKRCRELQVRRAKCLTIANAATFATRAHSRTLGTCCPACYHLPRLLLFNTRFARAARREEQL